MLEKNCVLPQNKIVRNIEMMKKNGLKIYVAKRYLRDQDL